jgi:hypothetical protein
MISIDCGLVTPHIPVSHKTLRPFNIESCFKCILPKAEIDETGRKQDEYR